MNAVTNSELYRIRKASGTYVVAAVLALLSVAGLAFLVAIQHFFSDSITLTADDFGTFFGGFTNYSSDGCVKMLLVLFVGSMVIKMYSSGSAKQLVSCGISRRNIVLGQFKGFVLALSAMTFVLAAFKGGCNLLFGKMGSAAPAHFLLCVVGTFVTVAFLTAFAMFIAHLTGNLAATFAACAAVLLGGGMAMMSLSFATGIDAFNDFWIDTLQANATSLDVSLTQQISSIGILAAATAVLVVLTVVVFSKKDIK